jgi:predicted outer membrane repeat protein
VATWVALTAGIAGLATGSTGHFTLTKGFVSPADSFKPITIAEGIKVTLFGGADSVIDAHSTGQMFIVKSSAALTMNRVTIQNGHSTTYTGGAVYVNGGSGTFANCIFTKNQAGGGGAVVIGIDGSTGKFTDCVFTSNSANTGGAVHVEGSATFTTCTFTGNHSPTSASGAVNVDIFGTGTFTNCEFKSNSASYGGAVDIYGTGTFSGCSFSGNTAWPAGNTALDNAYGGGAVFVDASAHASFDSCSFAKGADTSRGNNDLSRCTPTTGNCGGNVHGDTGTVSFGCPAGTTGSSVVMTAQDLLVTQLPPQQQVVHCVPKRP